MKDWVIGICIGVLIVLVALFFVPSRTDSKIQILQRERNAYRDSLAIARYEKEVLTQQLDTLQKIKIDEIRSVDSIHIDSLLLYIANFPAAQR